MTIDETTAVGQSNGEYGTVILELCGIKEEWTPIKEEPYWVSSVGKLRDQLEQLVELIKSRAAENARFHLEAAKAVMRVDRFLERVNKESG